MKLSEKRADHVYEYLVKKGISEDRLVKSFYGRPILSKIIKQPQAVLKPQGCNQDNKITV